MFEQVTKKLRDTARAIEIVGRRIRGLETVSVRSIFLLLETVILDFVAEKIPFFGYSFSGQWLAVADVMAQRADSVGTTAEAMALETSIDTMSMSNIHQPTLQNTLVGLYNELMWITSKQRWDLEKDADNLTIGERYKILKVMTLKIAVFLGNIPGGYGAKRVLYAVSQDLHSLQLQAGEPDYDVTHTGPGNPDAFSH